jgi:hypothetical protein
MAPPPAQSEFNDLLGFADDAPQAPEAESAGPGSSADFDGFTYKRSVQADVSSEPLKKTKEQPRQPTQPKQPTQSLFQAQPVQTTPLALSKPSAGSVSNAPASASSQGKQASAPVNHAAYQGLVQAQKFDGSWAVDAVISKAGLSAQPKDIKTAFESSWGAFKEKITTDCKVTLTEQKGAIDTEGPGMMGALLALVVLEKQYAAKRLEWTILAEKARSFLVKRFGKVVTASGSVDWVKQLDHLITLFTAAAKI